MSNLNEIYFVIGGYKVYLSLILIVAAIFFFFILLLVFLARRVKKKRAKIKLSKIEEYCSISTWQRQAIPTLLKKYNELKENSYILDYLENNKVWYAEEIMDRDRELIMRLDEIFFEEVKNNLKNSSYCFLILNMIDRINGGLGIRFSDKDDSMEWVSKSILGETQDERIMTVFNSGLNYALANNIYEEEYIDTVSMALAENDMWEYSDNVYAILIVSVYSYIKYYFIGKELDRLALSYIRVLAALFDRQDYDYSLGSLED